MAGSKTRIVFTVEPSGELQSDIDDVRLELEETGGIRFDYEVYLTQVADVYIIDAKDEETARMITDHLEKYEIKPVTRVIEA
ncbi:MAG: hypothetical protein SF029_02825 [bacterium]|nr:hypothetical protein [bacterium]